MKIWFHCSLIDCPELVKKAKGLYCDKDCGFWLDNGWDCDQKDADAFCRLKNCDDTSTALSYEITPAKTIPGFACRGIGEDLGVQTWVTGMVHVHFVDDIRAHHGNGNIVSNIVCSKPPGSYTQVNHLTVIIITCILVMHSGWSQNIVYFSM